MTIQELLLLAIKSKASDLHLVAGIQPAMRIDGVLTRFTNFPVLTNEAIEIMMFAVTKPDQKEALITNRELDFSVSFNGGTPETSGRFRVNAYYQRGTMAAALRFLPPVIKTIDELGLPKIIHSFAELKQGLVLVCGPTGQGKSSTLSAIINEINQNRYDHILTIEDPIEFIYPPAKSIISQREMGIDSHSWANSLRAALREDPDVVLVGEARDPETMGAAITVAETGHLVFTTLHTNSAAQSIDRIVDSFPPHQQEQIRIQLAATLKGIVSQRLLPRIGGGRVAAFEILVGTPAVASNVREGKTHLIDTVIQTSQEQGMTTLESSLVSLVKNGAITVDMAKTYAMHSDELMRLLSA